MYLGISNMVARTSSSESARFHTATSSMMPSKVLALSSAHPSPMRKVQQLPSAGSMVSSAVPNPSSESTPAASSSAM